MAKEGLASGGGEISVSNDGQVLVKSRSDKSVRVTSDVAAKTVNFAADAGSTDAYAITLDSVVFAAYAAGQQFWFKANTANTGAASLNVNGLGAKTIKKVAGGITTDLATNEILAGQYVHVVYDGTNFQMLSASGLAAQSALTNPVVGVAASYKVARGEHTQVAASDTVASGLTTVVSVVVSPRTRTVKQLFFNASPGDQAGAPVAGSFLLTSQKPTAVNDVTPIDATDFTDDIVVDWVAVGT